jgi:hypothetical protein
MRKKPTKNEKHINEFQTKLDKQFETTNNAVAKVQENLNHVVTSV